MITKHPNTERLRKLRPIFFQTGLLIALGITLAAFKWTTYGDNVVMTEERGKIDTTYEMLPINIIEDYKKEVETKKKIKLTPPDPDKINLVNDKTEIEPKKEEKEDPYKQDLDALLKAKPKNPNTGPPVFVPDNTITEAPEIMPSYPGGNKARVKFIKKNIRFPYDIQSEPRTISVYVSAVIEKNGSLTNIKVVKDGGFPSAGEAAMKVVEQMPRWNPGYQGIWPVRVKIVIPIKFRVE